MELQDVIRARRMVHRFDRRRSIPPELLERVLESALHAPSAGFSQGVALLVLDKPDQLDSFWRKTLPPTDSEYLDEQLVMGPPVVVLALANKQIYLDRYSEPDKAEAKMQKAEDWPAPYWDIDCGMSVMLMLLTAVDVGLGGWFFGIPHGQAELMRDLGVPPGYKPIGAIGLGYKAADDIKAGSSVTRRRRTLAEIEHRGRW
jgi:nitroreductase